MNTKDYTYLLNKPYSLNERQTADLEKILSEFPFLQSARAIYLKGLYNQDSFRYNTELKKTAAYTTDRSVLFDFITSEQFQSVDKDVFNQLQQEVQTIDVNHSEVVTLEQEETGINKQEEFSPADRLEESIKRLATAVEENPAQDTPVIKSYEERLEDSLKLSISSTESKEEIEPETETTEIILQTEEKLDIGKPLDFNKDETHSFAEWLQLSRFTPIDRSEEETHDVTEQTQAEEETENEVPLNKKMDLIDRFIETNPKIGPAKNTTPTPVNIERSAPDNTILMTETLARVYLEQKKYSKAIQAYEILILKYPEKSVFFADRISDIKIIQQNNNLKNDA